MKRILMLLVVVVSVLSHARGQNTIDNRMNMFSNECIGASTFTSVIERNPATHKVKKVVKVLKTSSYNAASFVGVFVSEAGSGTFSETEDGNKVTMLLTIEKNDCTRIYMLTYDKRKTSVSDGSVTTIVKYRKR